MVQPARLGAALEEGSLSEVRGRRLRRPARATFADLKQGTTDCTNAARPANGCCRLAFVGSVSRISRVNGVSVEQRYTASNCSQRRVNWKEQHQELEQIMSLRNGQACFFKQGLEILLSTLLAMKAYQVIERVVFVWESFGGQPVCLGDSHPLPGCLFHRGPFPCSRSLCETTHVPPAASRDSTGFAR